MMPTRIKPVKEILFKNQFLRFYKGHIINIKKYDSIFRQVANSNKDTCIYI